MCAPIALGLLSAGVGVMGAVGQHQSAAAQADAANQSSIRNYKYQLKMRERNWDNQRHLYSQQKHEYSQQTTENYSAAQRAYSAEQRKLNEAYMSMAMTNQDMNVSLLNEQGKTAAAGRTGKSADRLEAGMLAQFGRNQAVLAESLVSAGNAYRYGTESIRGDLKAANRQAYSSVAVAPTPGVAPPKPVMQQGPSGIGLMAGIGGAALGGLQTYNGLKAPPAYITPSPIG